MPALLFVSLDARLGRALPTFLVPDRRRSLETRDDSGDDDSTDSPTPSLNPSVIIIPMAAVAGCLMILGVVVSYIPPEPFPMIADSHSFYSFAGIEVPEPAPPWRPGQPWFRMVVQPSLWNT